MMRALLLFLGLACIGLAFWFLRTKGGPAAAPVSPHAAAPVRSASAAALSGAASTPAIALPAKPNAAATPAGAAFSPPDAAAMREVDQVSLMIRDYRTLAGENPVGTNAEIMRAVMGGNPKHATLGPPEGMSLNENGELIDRWGTPYFFHQLSKNHMEIRSAGPDKILWTEDDPVIR